MFHHTFYRGQATLKGGKVIALLACVSMAQACSSLTAQLRERDVTYQHPPQVGALLQPQNSLVICTNQQAAVAMAITGFFVEGCRKLEKSNTWRVVSVTFKDLKRGQTLWLTEVQRDNRSADDFSMGTADNSETKSPIKSYWSPIPWHDWA